MDQAPDYYVDPDGYHYPNDGERIGPAWRTAWRLLGDCPSLSEATLVDVMCSAGGIAPRTAHNLLRAAIKHGALAEDRFPCDFAAHRSRGHTHARYRRPARPTA